MKKLFLLLIVGLSVLNGSGSDTSSLDKRVTRFHAGNGMVITTENGITKIEKNGVLIKQYEDGKTVKDESIVSDKSIPKASERISN